MGNRGYIRFLICYPSKSFQQSDSTPLLRATPPGPCCAELPKRWCGCAETVHPPPGRVSVPVSPVIPLHSRFRVSQLAAVRHPCLVLEHQSSVLDYLYTGRVRREFHRGIAETVVWVGPGRWLSSTNQFPVSGLIAETVVGVRRQCRVSVNSGGYPSTVVAVRRRDTPADVFTVLPHESPQIQRLNSWNDATLHCSSRLNLSISTPIPRLDSDTPSRIPETVVGMSRHSVGSLSRNR